MTTLDKMLQGLANALGASLSTLTTTAKTVVGAINELKSGLTTTTNTVSGHTSIIGSGSLDTTSQTIIPAVNELKSSVDAMTIVRRSVSGESLSVSHTSQYAFMNHTITLSQPSVLHFRLNFGGNVNAYPVFANISTSFSILDQVVTFSSNSDGVRSVSADYAKFSGDTVVNGYHVKTHANTSGTAVYGVMYLPAGSYKFGLKYNSSTSTASNCTLYYVLI